MNQLMEAIKNRAGKPKEDELPPMPAEEEVKAEPLVKEDLSLVKKALGFLHDVKAENSELEGIISSLMAFYKVQNKGVGVEKAQPIEFGAEGFPAPNIAEGTGLPLNKEVY